MHSRRLQQTLPASEPLQDQSHMQPRCRHPSLSGSLDSKHLHAEAASMRPLACDRACHVAMQARQLSCSLLHMAGVVLSSAPCCVPDSCLCGRTLGWCQVPARLILQTRHSLHSRQLQAMREVQTFRPSHSPFMRPRRLLIPSASHQQQTQQAPPYHHTLSQQVQGRPAEQAVHKVRYASLQPSRSQQAAGQVTLRPVCPPRLRSGHTPSLLYGQPR